MTLCARVLAQLLARQSEGVTSYRAGLLCLDVGEGDCLRWSVVAVAGESKLGWMDDIEDSDKANAHAVGELGRLDPSYERAERVRAQARSVALGASKMENVFEKVGVRPLLLRPRGSRAVTR